jgi:hypothetical protein
LIPKPSQLIREAYENGVKKVVGAYQIDDSYCSRGIVLDKYLDLRAKYLLKKKKCPKKEYGLFHQPYYSVQEFELNIYSYLKFGKLYHTATTGEKVSTEMLLNFLLIQNDNSPHRRTFKSAAKVLEDEGL